MNTENKIVSIGINANGQECKIPQYVIDVAAGQNAKSLVYFGCDATIYENNRKLLVAKGSSILNSNEMTAICGNKNLVVSIRPDAGVITPKFLIPEDVQNQKYVIDYLCSKARLAMVDDVCKYMLGVKFYRGTSRTMNRHGFDLKMAIKMIKETDSVSMLSTMIEKKPEWSVVRKYWSDLSTPRAEDRFNYAMTAAMGIISNNDELMRRALMIDVYKFNFNEYKQAVDILMSHNIDINDLGGENPLAVKVLSYQFAKSHMLNHNQEFRKSVRDNYMKVISLLVKSGAWTDIRIDQLKGKTVAEYAFDSGDQDLIDALKLNQRVKQRKPGM